MFKKGPKIDPIVNSLIQAREMKYRTSITNGELLAHLVLDMHDVKLNESMTVEDLNTFLKSFLDTLEAHSFVIYNNAVWNLRSQEQNTYDNSILYRQVVKEIKSYIDIAIKPAVDRLHQRVRGNSSISDTNALADWAQLSHRIMAIKSIVGNFIMSVIKKNYTVFKSVNTKGFRVDETQFSKLISEYQQNDPTKFAAILPSRLEYVDLVADDGKLKLPNQIEPQAEIIRWLDRVKEG